MIDGKRVVAVIPARGGSKGLPRKNVLPVHGKPLIAWSIAQGLAAEGIDRVVVSTDDSEIAEVSRVWGADVPFMRPTALATDTATSIDVLMHTLDTLAAAGDRYDIVVLLEPTSPLREVADIDGALRTLVGDSRIESVVGVSAVEGAHPVFLYRCESGLLRPYLSTVHTGVRRQDLDPLYFLEGSVYVSYVDALRQRASFYHDATAPWVVPRYKSIEIDELHDLITVEALMVARAEGRIG